jgi:hypothetical protein
VCDCVRHPGSCGTISHPGCGAASFGYDKTNKEVQKEADGEPRPLGLRRFGRPPDEQEIGRTVRGISETEQIAFAQEVHAHFAHRTPNALISYETFQKLQTGFICELLVQQNFRANYTGCVDADESIHKIDQQFRRQLCGVTAVYPSARAGTPSRVFMKSRII